MSTEKISTDLLKRLGFDQSSYDRRCGTWRVRCSQCEASVINGIPCHEHGCPNSLSTRRKHAQNEG
jgi:hypothetical protein